MTGPTFFYGSNFKIYIFATQYAFLGHIGVQNLFSLRDHSYFDVPFIRGQKNFYWLLPTQSSLGPSQRIIPSMH